MICNSYSNSSIDDSFYKEISMKTCSYEIFGSTFYTLLNSEDEPCVSMYIETIKNGNPDKEAVIKWLGNTTSTSSARIYSILCNIDVQLQPILDSIKRDKRINDILDK